MDDSKKFGGAPRGVVRPTLIKIGLALVVCSVGVWPAVGQEATQEPGTQANWMLDYVDLRTYAMFVSAVGQSRADEIPVRERIVGGTIAGAADNPFQVALLKKNISNNFDAQYCGGTLIKEKVIVTAAHCSDFVTANQVQVLTGTRKLDGTGTRRNVSRIVVHPNWNKNTFANDVAVWHLSTSASGISLATLAASEGAVGGNLLATGWGRLTESGSYPIELRRVTVPLVSIQNCNDSNSYNGAVIGSMICAGLDAGGRDTCQGDSGGPLTKGVGNKELTGITSWGRGCAKPNYFGVYTKVSQPGVKSFIENND